jgi:hypothetical protein
VKYRRYTRGVSNLCADRAAHTSILGSLITFCLLNQVYLRALDSDILGPIFCLYMSPVALISRFLRANLPPTGPLLADFLPLYSWRVLRSNILSLFAQLAPNFRSALDFWSLRPRVLRSAALSFIIRTLLFVQPRLSLPRPQKLWRSNNNLASSSSLFSGWLWLFPTPMSA